MENTTKRKNIKRRNRKKAILKGLKGHKYIKD
jgi:hypothetical protein